MAIDRPLNLIMDYRILDFDRDAAIEAANEAIRAADGSDADVATTAVTAAFDYLDRQPYPTTFGRRPAPAEADPWPLGPGEDDAEVWIPPTQDCLLMRYDQPCPHCGSPDFHQRTRRCARCGRRPSTLTPEDTSHA